MTPQVKKAMRWLYRIAIALAVIAVIAPLSHKLAENMPSESATGTNDGERCYFKEGETSLKVHLEPDKWSCWIVTPPRTDYRIDPDDDHKEYKIRFWDGEEYTHSPESIKWFGIKRGIFKIKSKEPMTITVTVEN